MSSIGCAGGWVVGAELDVGDVVVSDEEQAPNNNEEDNIISTNSTDKLLFFILTSLSLVIASMALDTLNTNYVNYTSFPL